MLAGLTNHPPVFDPPLDYRDHWPPVDDATGQKLIQLYHSRRWTAFDPVEGIFTDAFAAHHGTRHGVMMVNGTVTLQCAIGAYGIGPGDEVIVPALTWYATAMGAYYIGATPVFVDIKSDTLCIDPAAIEAAITERTKAIIPVHLYGSMANMDEIMGIAEKYGLRVIEDCAHVHGGIWAGRRVGSIGNVGSFSFQQTKTMASAEGGICITNDDEIAELIFRMKHIGYKKGERPGQDLTPVPADLRCYPFRATGFQAVILGEQLKSLDRRLETYAEAVSYLEDRLVRTTKIRFQQRPSQVDLQGYFGWVMIFDDPAFNDRSIDEIKQAFDERGLPLMKTWDPVYRFRLFNLKPNEYRIASSCDVTERLVPRILWMHHALLGLGMPVVERIAEAMELAAAALSKS